MNARALLIIVVAWVGADALILLWLGAAARARRRRVTPVGGPRHRARERVAGIERRLESLPEGDPTGPGPGAAAQEAARGG